MVARTRGRKRSGFFLRGRLSFDDSGQSAPFPSALVVWGANPKQLAALQQALPTAWSPHAGGGPAALA